MSINTSNIYPSNAEEDDFEINLDLIDTKQVLVTNYNPQLNQIGANFILDLGSTKHVITNREYFISYKDSQTRISWGTDTLINSIGIGNIELVNKGNKIILENCLYVPNFQYNLISVSKLDQLSYKIVVKGGQAYIFKNKQLLISAAGRNSLYYIDIVINNLPSKETKKVKSKQINKIEPINKINLLEQTKLWHQRIGYINPISLQKTVGLQLNIPLDKYKICIESKLTNQRNKEIHLEKVVTNLYRPISPQTINSNKGIPILNKRYKTA